MRCCDQLVVVLLPVTFPLPVYFVLTLVSGRISDFPTFLRTGETKGSACETIQLGLEIPIGKKIVWHFGCPSERKGI